MKQCNTAIAMAALLLSLAGPVLAHTKMTGSLPESGSTLQQSPATIEIRFEHAVNLTSAVLVETGKAERTLAFLPAGSASTFKIADPKLNPGRTEIRWKALSSDGHVSSGTLVFIVKSAAVQSG